LLLCNRCFALRWLPNQKSLHLSLSLFLSLFLLLGIDARELEILEEAESYPKAISRDGAMRASEFPSRGRSLGLLSLGARLVSVASTRTHTQTDSTTAAATKRSVLFFLLLLRYYVDITRRWQRSNCGMYRLRLAPLLKEKKLSRTVTSGSDYDGNRPDDPSTLR